MENLKRYESLIIYFIRTVIAVIFFHHGFDKVFDFETVVEKYETMGFPGLLWVILGIMEMTAVVYLFNEKRVRQASLFLAAVISMAILTVQLPAALYGTANGAVGALERDLLILGCNFLIAATGGGALRVAPAKD